MANVTDVLKQGMNTEIWGKRFYEEAVARTSSEDGKRIFQSLVDEEAKHLDILRGQYAALSEDDEYVSVEDAIAMADSVDPADIFPEAAMAGQLIPDDATDEQALEMAMEFERQGYKLYQSAASEAKDDSEREMWEYLAEAEDYHYAFLQETHEYLTNEGKWYFDERELPFFEG